MKKITQSLFSTVLAIAFVLAGMPVTANAAAMTVLSDNMSRQKISTISTHVITFTPATTDVGPTTITFPGGFNVAGVTGGTAAGQVVTVTGGSVAGTPRTITLGNITNPGSAANYLITLATGADTGEITVPIIADDQIQITAKVDQTLFFAVRDASSTDNAVGFGSLSSSSIRYANDAGTGSGSETATGSSQFEAATNATGGYTVAVSGATLTSGANTITAATGTPASPGSEQFGLSVDVVTGTGTITASYGGTNYDLPAPATEEIIVTKATQSANEVYGVNYVANISGATEPGIYATAMTYTMTANF